MKKRHKKPSQLWDEASDEAYRILNDIVMKLHRMWQQSIHFNPNFKSNRVPKAKVRLNWQENAELVEFIWEGEGADQHLVVELDSRNPTFFLLANEEMIRLLKVWLAISDETGFAGEDFLARADRLDFRQHLKSFESYPSAIQWALIELYDLLFDSDPTTAAIGFDTWGFWRTDQPKFSQLQEAKIENPEFGTLEQFLTEPDIISPFRSICLSGQYEYSFFGLADFSIETRISLWHFQESRFGTLTEFLVSQPKHSKEYLFGQTYRALKALLTVEFQETSFSMIPRVIATRTDKQYGHIDLAKNLIIIGQNLSDLSFRLSEERRALLARKFEGRRKNRTADAVKSNRLDKQRRESAILGAVKNFREADYLTKTSNRLNCAKLARDVAKIDPFGSTKSGMGTRAITKFLRDSQTRLVFKS
ncbi:hypothetical protein N9L47_10635 [Rhodobacteraceae bacterium]|nr:hypothetical protein [Paracoccaceae bacterium]